MTDFENKVLEYLKTIDERLGNLEAALSVNNEEKVTEPITLKWGGEENRETPDGGTR